MEIKKGDRFKCKRLDLNNYVIGYIYESEVDGCITGCNGCYDSWQYVSDEIFSTYFEKLTEDIDACRPKQDSPTSPSHYRAYDMESIEMMIRIWGKQRVAEWCEITAFKYRCRVGMKDDVQQDLQKEAYYLAKWKELRDDVTG